MSSPRDTLHLLLLTKTQNDAEQLISLLRNSGYATRAQSVSSHEQFEESLRSARWDVIVADPNLRDIQFTELLNQVHRLNLDIPLILVPEEADGMLLESALIKGAAAVVPFEESNSLVLTIKKEIQNLRTRKDIRILQVRLREAEKRCRTLLESSRDPIAYIHDGMHVYANQAYLELFGYEHKDEIEGITVLDVIAADSQNEFKDFLKNYQSGLPEGQILDIKAMLGNGSQCPVQVTFSEANFSDEPCIQIQLTLKDQHEELKVELDELRSRDSTTNLFNKDYFLERMTRALDHAVIEKQFSTLIYVSIDHFDTIKREVGMKSADDVVIAISDCITAQAEKFDITARIGDGIFAWMMPGGEPNKAREHAQKLLTAVNQLLVDLEQRTIQPTVSIGITMITDNSPSPQESLQQAQRAADAVAHENPEQKGNGLHLYMPADQTIAHEVKELQEQLIEALRKNTLKLAFQPLISLRGEEGEHYEVLLRLPQSNNPDLSAAEFINSDQVSDDIKKKIDRWVILHSTKLLAEHQRKGNDTRIFINLSSASFRDNGLPAWIQVALKAANLNHNSVIFQITEEDAVRHTAPAKRFSYQIRACGLSMAVNRFGCELQPLKLLENVEFDYVKIDGSYTQELGSSAARGKALRTLLEGIHAQGKISIAPFVESATSVSGIWQYGVHFIQGYYVQAPQGEMSYDFSEE